MVPNTLLATYGFLAPDNGLLNKPLLQVLLPLLVICLENSGRFILPPTVDHEQGLLVLRPHDRLLGLALLLGRLVLIDGHAAGHVARCY